MNKKIILVYQAGIANVFEVDCLNLSNFGREAKRILQADFKTCENFVQGLKYADYIISSAYCNEAGDITDSHWNDYLMDAPFSDKFHPVFNKVAICDDVREYYHL